MARIILCGLVAEAVTLGSILGMRGFRSLFTVFAFGSIVEIKRFRDGMYLLLRILLLRMGKNLCRHSLVITPVPGVRVLTRATSTMVYR